jgi:hypothetical protein
MDVVRADLRLHRVEQDRLQIAAMDRELRPWVARPAPQRLLIDELAEAVEKDTLGGLDRDARERRLQAELAERLGRVRQEVDADPDRLDLGRGLEDAARNAAPMQLQCERQAADAGPDDEYLASILQPVVLSDETRSMCLPILRNTMSTADAEASKRAES